MIRFMGKTIQVEKNSQRSSEDVEVKLEKDDSGNQILELSFSSEKPYKRWYGFEIISHEKGAINLERLNTKAPLLFNHDWDKQLGVIEEAWIGKDKRGYVKVKCSRSDFALDKLKDVEDGILTSASFGYMIEEMVLSKQSDEGNEYTVTKCFPYEVSLVTIPADYSVGVGRMAKDANEKLEVRSVMTEDEPEQINPIIPENVINHPAVKAAFQGGKMEDLEKGKAAEKLRILTIKKLGEKFNKPELAQSLIDGDKTVEESRGAFLEALGHKQKPVGSNDAEIGMTETEKKKFSFIKAMNFLANPNDRRAMEAAKFEIECSRAAAEKAGKAAQGLMIPVDILGLRDLTVGSNTGGGYTVASELKAESFIDLLRNKSVIQRAGAQLLNGLVGNILIPRQTGAATSYWVAESSAPTESALAVDQVSMSPKTVGAFSDVSRKLLLQSSVDVEQMVKKDLAAVLALAIDKAALYGSGSSNQPLGLTGVTGLNIVDLAAATPTFLEMVAMETAIASDNADVEVMKYLMNAAGRGALKGKEKAAGYPQYVFENNMVNGYGTEVSNQINAGDFFFGNWQDLLIGFWSGLDLMVDPYTASTSGTVRIVALQDCDIAARHGESFCRAYEVP